MLRNSVGLPGAVGQFSIHAYSQNKIACVPYSHEKDFNGTRAKIPVHPAAFEIEFLRLGID